jgi:hypothetical protein
MCYEKAGAVCGEKGYIIIDRSGDESGTTVVANQYGLYGGSMTNRSLIIKCKDTTGHWKRSDRTSKGPLKDGSKLQLNKDTGDWEIVRPKKKDYCFQQYQPYHIPHTVLTQTKKFTTKI